MTFDQKEILVWDCAGIEMPSPLIWDIAPAADSITLSSHDVLDTPAIHKDYKL